MLVGRSYLGIWTIYKKYLLFYEIITKTAALYCFDDREMSLSSAHILVSNISVRPEQYKLIL